MTKAMNQYEGKTLRYYYEHKYNIHIKNLKQPLLRVESKRRKGGQRILLVPELLLMTGIPESVD